MNTLYWITVLGNISDAGLILLKVLLMTACGIGLFALIICLIDENKEDEIKTKKAFNITKKLLLYSIIPLLIVTFTPSTQQLYAIYGVGTVIDYAKESKEVQKLPDNAVKALNVWLENVNKDKKDSTNITK